MMQLLSAPLVLTVAACGIAEGETATAPAPALPLGDPPRTIFTTNEFEVGATYTLGSTSVTSAFQCRLRQCKVRPKPIQQAHECDSSGVLTAARLRAPIR